jgi:hypothetical protein
MTAASGHAAHQADHLGCASSIAFGLLRTCGTRAGQSLR